MYRVPTQIGPSEEVQFEHSNDEISEEVKKLKASTTEMVKEVRSLKSEVSTTNPCYVYVK